MKKLLLIAFVFVTTTVLGQENKLKSEAAAYSQKEDKLILFISSDNWSGLPSNLESNPIRSHGFSFSFMNELMGKKGNAGVGIGLGFMSQNVHTDGYIVDTTADESYSMLAKIPDSLNYSLNKLSLNFLTLAFELRFRTNENVHGERFKVSAGITAAILLQSHTKYDDINGKFKTYNVEHLNDFQYGLTGRVGYSNYAISGYFSLVDVFEKDKGVKLTPYSVGISFTF